ncbi:MAG: 2-amino-4-hydroxy-6-hydroxymethyldihydropteridine diphosphokinase [Deltaproteobacteria bacterium]|jgi:2-amino-4-hydroxy-6-hydroxymethyldihydropteridine diphosphokinase|nr:2-amino-4-hydroxy-6-hydroxymethyldihydropteridine diphosphokinase [Deltaproteobacteria bacterium]
MNSLPARELAIGFGANLEEPLVTFQKAEELLAKNPNFCFRAKSSVYLTEPMGGPSGQNWYHNQVVIYETQDSPIPILNFLLEVEKSLGRVRKERWGPRIIDLDLLYLGDCVFIDSMLKVPHPRLAERAFTLVPLSEIRPTWIHPELGLTTSELLHRLPEGEQGLIKLT